MTPPALGALVHSFFADGLLTMKGLRPASVRSYRDVLRLFLRFVAHDTGRKITRLALGDLSFERVLRFARYLEDERRNHIRTRNQRVACLHTFFDYLAGRVPELLEVAERVAAIPMKRVPPPETRFLERDEIDSLFATLPVQGAQALRDRALLLFLYNTGARVQEAADLHVSDLELAPPARVRLHGKGDKWRTCPAVGGYCAAPPPSPRSAGDTRPGHSGVRLAPGASADTLRHLQARAPPYPPA
jgi:site-specific recombinase XerD